MRVIVGPPVTKDNFFNRQAELNSIVNSLENSNSIYLLSGRRMGKTSFLLNLMDIYADRFNFTYFDLEGTKN